MLAGIDAIGGFVAGGTGGSLNAEVSPTSLSKTQSSSGSPRTLTTTEAVVTVTGGSGGETYSWSRVSGNASVTATAPTSASSAFTATLSPDVEKGADFVCTVHDSAGDVVSTVPVSVTLALVLVG